MSNDNKTLADVQPGGRVRLATVPYDRARDLIGDAYNAGTHGIGYSQQAMELHDAIIPVQPTPGGQDALHEAARRVISDIDSGGYGGTISMATYDALAAALAARQPVGEHHPDDLAVDAFAAAMKAKMAEARAKGRGGWEDPAQCTAEGLSRMLREHVEKGDPRDVANFCMMLHQRGEAIAASHPVEQEPVGYLFTDDPAVYAMPGSGFHSGKEPPADAINVVPVYAATPAQAVDLDELRRAVCVVNVVGQIDGHDVVRRNSLLDVIDNRRQRLTESQVVQP
ncbi:hypothetical protein U2S91_08160 [Stenotrophomonas maltophilia]|nr:hypothetical protein [Stenotrophomonas maltophilia]WQI22597.1 hypothetical protein U2S91_08160 [Stenotrophomonas maltophilia]